ncbi:MAG TPA: SIR2 family protein [Chthonomonadaceae bacterium]|nr:SIR2 family protein [Chthonomonadaceae bacterium]
MSESDVPRKIENLDWELIVERIHSGQCVPFLGAAVNASRDGYLGLELANGVTKQLVEDLFGIQIDSLEDCAKVSISPGLGETLKEHLQRQLNNYPDLSYPRIYDLSRVAFHVYRKVGEDKRFMELLQRILPDQKRQPSKLLRVLARLPVKLIVTTNYDRLMERALMEASFIRPDMTQNPVAQLLQQVPPGPFLQKQLSKTSLAVLEKDPSSKEAGQVAAKLLNDIKDPVDLITSLADWNNPISVFLMERFQHYTRALIEGFGKDISPSHTLILRVIINLNRIISEVRLYEQEVFKSLIDQNLNIKEQIEMVPEAEDQISVHPMERKARIYRINRTLLELAYPNALDAIDKDSFIVLEQPINGFKSTELKEYDNLLSEHEGTIVYKIHGGFCDVEPPGGYPPVVITEEDYIQFLTVMGNPKENIPRLLQEKLPDSTLLFLGYGLEDWDFRTLYKSWIEQLPKNMQRKSFAIRLNPPKYWVDFWKEKKVTIYDMDLYEFAKELEIRYKAYRASHPIGREGR